MNVNATAIDFFIHSFVCYATNISCTVLNSVSGESFFYHQAGLLVHIGNMRSVLVL